MKSLLICALLSLSAFAVDIGKKAPDFKTLDAHGKEVTLSQFKGKTVVLEWLNHGCPFVRKHYDSGNMQALQKDYTAKGIVWLSVISSAEGKQGFGTPTEVLADAKKNNSGASAILIDSSGAIGNAYEAKTTPHMYVINPEGNVIYQGAIDDKASTDVADIKGAKNYVKAALDDTLAGRKIASAQTKAYGCGVKYK